MFRGRSINGIASPSLSTAGLSSEHEYRAEGTMRIRGDTQIYRQRNCEPLTFRALGKICWKYLQYSALSNLFENLEETLDRPLEIGEIKMSKLKIAKSKGRDSGYGFN